MELDAKGGASFEQLQDLIKKECDKREKNIDPWNKNTTNCKNLLNTHNPQKLTNEGPTRRLQQKEIATNKPAKGAKPTRSIGLKTTPLTTHTKTEKTAVPTMT